jgi:hypothetical protein
MIEIAHFKVFVICSDDVTADLNHLHVKRIHLGFVHFHEKQSHYGFNPHMNWMNS